MRLGDNNLPSNIAFTGRTWEGKCYGPTDGRARRYWLGGRPASEGIRTVIDIGFVELEMRRAPLLYIVVVMLVILQRPMAEQKPVALTLVFLEVPCRDRIERTAV